MLRTENTLFLNKEDRDVFHRTTGLFIRSGDGISLEAYNGAIEAAAKRAYDLDPDGFGYLDATLIRGHLAIDTKDASTEMDHVRRRIAAADKAASG
jgi:hypothetical protein